MAQMRNKSASPTSMTENEEFGALAKAILLRSATPTGIPVIIDLDIEPAFAAGPSSPELQAVALHVVEEQRRNSRQDLSTVRRVHWDPAMAKVAAVTGRCG